MRRIEIQPCDVVLFRDARPFGYAAAGGAAFGVFPPHPSTLVGAIRTAAYRAYGVSLRARGGPVIVDSTCEAVWGTAEKLGSARICGTGLWKGKALWPSPAHLVRPRGVEGAVRRAVPWSQPPWCASTLDGRLWPLWVPEPGEWEAAAGYLSSADLRLALSTREPPKPMPENDLVYDEPREGIALDDRRRTTRTGALFQVTTRRLKDDTGFAVWLEGDEDRPFPEHGMLRLGQDGKLAAYRTQPAGVDDWPAAPAVEGRRFVLYCATPARFADGWLPSWVDAESLQVTGRGWQARLVAAALPRPTNVGGWDLGRQSPRALHPVVHAGAVYFFEAPSEEDAQSAVTELHGRCISEGAPDDPQFMSPATGWGLCFTGAW